MFIVTLSAEPRISVIWSTWMRSFIRAYSGWRTMTSQMCWISPSLSTRKCSDRWEKPKTNPAFLYVCIYIYAHTHTNYTHNYTHIFLNIIIIIIIIIKNKGEWSELNRKYLYVRWPSGSWSPAGQTCRWQRRIRRNISSGWWSGGWSAVSSSRRRLSSGAFTR